MLTETWIKDEDEAIRSQLPSYTHYYSYRKDKGGGGVSIHVHNSLKHNLVEEHCLNHIHYLWVHVKKFGLDIGAIYKPDQKNTSSFLDTYAQQLQQRRRAVVFGDFNFNLLLRDQVIRKYKDTIKENGYKILNKVHESYCTRVTPSTKSIIDHVHTNLKDNHFHFAVIESAMSDHRQIYLEIQKYQPEPITKVNYTSIDYNKLYENFEKAIKYDKVQEPEYEILEGKLTSSIIKSQVIKTKILNAPQKDWINKEIINEINKRNVLWDQVKKKESDDALRQQYNTAKTKVTKSIQKTKSAYNFNLNVSQVI